MVVASKVSQLSAIFPPTMRKMPDLTTSMRLPFAGIPTNSPWCVARATQRAATLSPSVAISSTVWTVCRKLHQEYKRGPSLSTESFL